MTRQGVNTEAVFKKDRRDFIRSISLLRIKARKAIEDITWKNFNIRHEIVGGWKRGMNMPRIVQS